jgi:hypothetical protein
MRVIEITLKKSIKDFCMSKGDTIEFFDGGFKHKEIDQPFYPNFGPYTMLNQIAEQMIAGQGNPEMHKTFDVEEKIKAL